MKSQEKLNVGTGLQFDIDITLFDAGTGEVKYILDTKYKDVMSSSTADVAQVVAYAKAKSCTNAMLVYPMSVEGGHDVLIGDEIRVRDISFRLDANLEQAGSSSAESGKRWYPTNVNYQNYFAAIRYIIQKVGAGSH